MSAAPRIVTDLPSLPPRDPRTHKAQCGRVVIVAGSRGMSGAAALAGLGALRAGAGLVRVCCPSSIAPIIAAGEPCLMTQPLPEHDGRLCATADPQLADSLDWADAIAIGPGLGASNGDDDLAHTIEFVLKRNKPIVADADALNAVAAAKAGWLRSGAPTVITPHPGEMRRLADALGISIADGVDDKTRIATATTCAERLGCVVLLKGHRTVVSDAKRAFVCAAGNAGMATGGMGDVLTGVIAALIGQGLAAFDAARLGAHLHATAADQLARTLAPVGYLAREVADAIPQARAQFDTPRMGFK
ncbi:MAG: NAD(P)H-hydrate dehydratase [Phycisphaerales bacterium]|nr:NAD(P)H-hydrate dehydratase [Phycisphaerales bacterium]